MTKNNVRDLTQGKPLGLIASFMLPLIFGLIFQQFYSMVDTVVVGKFLGVDALAGVGSTGPVNFLVLGMCNGICAGFAIPVAHKFGQRDYVGLRQFVGNMIWLCAGIALVVTVVTVLLCRWFLQLLGTPAEVLGYAESYIRIVFLGIPATMLYNLLSGILRSLGDSKSPLLFLIISSLTNVALDIVFILLLHMGVAGAAWATVLSQLVSGVLCLLYMAKKFPILHLSREDLRFRPFFAKKLLDMGLPMGFQYSITAIGSILLQTAINNLGPTAMAAITAGNKVSMLCACVFDAIGSTSATFAGQNIGAGKPERVKKGVMSCTVLGSVYSVTMLVVMYFFSGSLISLFLDTSDPQAVGEILSLSRRFLLTNMAFYIPLLCVNLYRFTIQGLGFSELAVFAGVMEMVARAVFGLGLVPMIGFNAVCFASPAAWILADAFLIPAYFHCMKRRSQPKLGIEKPHK